MPGLMRREPRGEVGEFFSRFDRMLDEWARMLPFRTVSFPRCLEAEDVIRVEEFREDGTLVVRADLPGIDPEKDVELIVSDGMLHIQAERREEEKKEEKGYLRRELRCGSRALPLPEGPALAHDRRWRHLVAGHSSAAPGNSARSEATWPPPPSTASASSTPSSCSPRATPGCPPHLINPRHLTSSRWTSSRSG